MTVHCLKICFRGHRDIPERFPLKMDIVIINMIVREMTKMTSVRRKDHNIAGGQSIGLFPFRNLHCAVCDHIDDPVFCRPLEMLIRNDKVAIIYIMVDG